MMLDAAWLQIRAIGRQSALHTAGPAAHEIGALWNGMLIAGAVVTLLTFAALGFALFRKRQNDALHDDEQNRLGIRAIAIAGIVLPTLVLSGVFAFSMRSISSTMDHGAAHDGAPSDGTIAIEITGKQYWWRVRYLNANTALEFETANELHIPVDVPVQLRLQSDDVIHSFWLPGLHGKMDLTPGRPSVLTIEADREGLWRGQCAEYCGMQHTMMAFNVIAVSATEFERWATGQRAIVDSTDARRGSVAVGQQTFMRAGCAPCHTIRGTIATGKLGPDLTHIASRLTLAAASFPNSEENLASWILDAQKHKRGSAMPTSGLTADQALSIARYLATLR